MNVDRRRMNHAGTNVSSASPLTTCRVALPLVGSRLPQVSRQPLLKKYIGIGDIEPRLDMPELSRPR